MNHHFVLLRRDDNRSHTHVEGTEHLVGCNATRLLECLKDVRHGPRRRVNYRPQCGWNGSVEIARYASAGDVRQRTDLS